MKVTLSGSITDAAATGGGDSTLQNERRALLVYEGSFESMGGPVEVTAEQIQRLADNHNGRLARLGPNVQPGDLPPVQVDHSTSGHDTVGRVVGNLEVGDLDGKVALYGHLRILGADNMERVADGRWRSLSIGADLDAGELQEVSITPFPAARRASLLSQHGGNMDPEKMLKYLMEECDLSKEDAEAKLAIMPDEEKDELSKRMADVPADEDKPNDKKEQLGDSEIVIRHDADGDGKITKASDEEGKDKDKDEVNLSDDEEDEEEKEFKAKMSTQMAAVTARASNLSIKLRRASIGSTIARLRANGKITPAEIKKLDIDALSRENDATLKAVMSSYENRQPVIMVGQFGSVRACEASEIAKEVAAVALEQETLKNMKFTAGALGKTVKLGAETDHNTSTSSVVRQEVMADDDGMWTEIVRAVRENRDDEGREMFRRACRMERGETAATEQDMSELMSAVCALSDEVGTIVQLAGPRLGIKL